MDKQTNSNLQQRVVQIRNQGKGVRYLYVTSLMYVISIYMVPVIFYVETMLEREITFSVCVFPLLFGIANIIVSIRFCQPENRIALLNAAVAVKYSLIPFFAIGGCIVVISLAFSFVPVPFMIFVGPIFALIEGAAGWAVLAFGAPYTISYLCASAKGKLRSKGMVIIHSILQFFFVADVIDLMVLAFRERKWRKVTMAILIVIAMMVLLILGFILLVIAREIAN